MEQLPLIGWRPPSAASSQAPSSGGTRMPKHYQSNRTREVSSEHSRSWVEIAQIRLGIALADWISGAVRSKIELEAMLGMTCSTQSRECDRNFG